MSNPSAFPRLDLSVWQPTRDTLHLYARLLGKIRQALTPPQEKWWHVSLRVDEMGLTTPPIPLPGRAEASFSLQLDLVNHHLVITSPAGEARRAALQNQSPQGLMEYTLSALKTFGAEPDIDQSLFSRAETGPYVPQQARTFQQALSSIHTVFQAFKASLAGKTGPVQLWPHHFDLAFEWFSGREANAPSGAPEGEEGGEEQIGFGFSTGDETVSEAYFYANPWPFQASVVGTPLPDGARWYTESWRGGLLLYHTVAAARDPAGVLSAYLEAVYRNASALMKD